MNIENTEIWQQASGNKNRDYAQLCLDWDVVLNGPGYAGKWPECIDLLKKDKACSERKLTDVRRFCSTINSGDIIVLRSGTNSVRGVGRVIGEYAWMDSFSDVDGWDLQHVRRVQWLWKGDQHFDTYDLKLGDTTQKLTSQPVKEWLRNLDISDPVNPQELQELPEANGRNVTQQEIAEYLFEKGVSSNSIECLMQEFGELLRIAKWYSGNAHPSEFETEAYLIIPILRALGWTPQKMAIEWHHVDIALFDNLPRKDENLSVVVEAKKKGNSCLTAQSQAQGYAQSRESCKRLFVSDGLRYGIYVKDEETRTYILKAYFNLLNLKEEYPIYKCFGIKDALMIMSPEWRP